MTAQANKTNPTNSKDKMTMLFITMLFTGALYSFLIVSTLAKVRAGCGSPSGSK